MRFILQSKKESKRATSASKITIDKREARDDAREAKKIKVEAKKTKANTRASARIDAKMTTIATTTTTTTTNRKQSLRLHERFACTHVSFVLETTLILSSCLLLFNNSQECASNTLYNQKLIKLLN